MLKGGKAQLQVRGGRNHRSLDKELVNLDVSGKERWEEGTFQAEEMSRTKVNMGANNCSYKILILG